MSLIIRAAAIAIALALIAPSMVMASDYLTDAVTALKQSSVYVAPGTEGTDSDTASNLRNRLTSRDDIVLVMLPSTAEKELGMDITTIAMQLSNLLGNQKVIGLSVGDKVVAYAPPLPAGVANDQMRRAKSVSNDTVTTLGTFAQNVRIWEASNPRPSPSPSPSPSPTPSPSSSPTATDNGRHIPTWVVLIVIVGIVVAIGGVAIYLVRHKPTPPPTGPDWP